MTRYTVWVKVALDLSFDVDAASYNDAAFLGAKRERVFAALRKKKIDLQDYTIKTYGVFNNEEEEDE